MTTTLILTGLAVAFAFRCGLFNIGGQGQYFGSALFASLWVGTHLHGTPRPLHVVIGIGAGILGGVRLGRDRGLPQGDRRRPRGDHDDHAQLDRDLRRAVPLRARRTAAGRGTGCCRVRRRRRARPSCGSSGAHVLQGLHVGFFFAIAALVLFFLILNRTTLGYEVRAVGFNPEAARYGGIPVRTKLLPRARDRGRLRRACAARSTCSATSTRSTRATLRPASASSGSRSRCSAATSRSGSSSPRSSSPALQFGTSSTAPRP